MEIIATHVSQHCMFRLAADPNHIKILNPLISSAGGVMSFDDYRSPFPPYRDQEINVHKFLSVAFGYHLAKDFRNYWVHNFSATKNIPDLDYISACKINGRHGVLIIEAKAHRGELIIKNKKNKPAANNAGKNNNEVVIEVEQNASNASHQVSQENSQDTSQDTSQETCIDKKTKSDFSFINSDLIRQLPDIKLSSDNCRQLSNHLAIAYYLASKGFPVIVLYLGFLLKGSKKYFKTNEEWQDNFLFAARKIGVHDMLNKRIYHRHTSISLLCASLEAKAPRKTKPKLSKTKKSKSKNTELKVTPKKVKLKRWKELEEKIVKDKIGKIRRQNLKNKKTSIPKTPAELKNNIEIIEQELINSQIGRRSFRL
ncbi:hypothetical protein BH10BAC5_BH10BAC5_12870 [soil metagenome]